MNLFQQFGTLTGMAIVLVAIARPLVVPWLNERIRAGVDELDDALEQVALVGRRRRPVARPGAAGA